jgi:ankyrin repeat protein
MAVIANDDDEGVRAWLADPGKHIEDTEKGKNQTALCYSVRQGSARCTKCLIEASADVNAKMSGNATSLYLAAQESQREAIELLIKHGADINATTDNGASPIFVAALSNNRTCVEMLIEVSSNAESHACCIFLVWRFTARFFLHLHAFFVTQAGADVNLAAKSGATPLQMAREENFGLIAEVLVKAGVSASFVVQQVSQVP